MEAQGEGDIKVQRNRRIIILDVQPEIEKESEVKRSSE